MDSKYSREKQGERERREKRVERRKGYILRMWMCSHYRPRGNETLRRETRKDQDKRDEGEKRRETGGE